MPTIDPNDEPLLARYLGKHPIEIASIHTQPFLGDGIVGQKTDQGWEIMIYPARYYDGWSTSMILEVLEEIDRKENHRTRFKDHEDFETLLGRFTNQIQTSEDERSLELLENEAWHVKGALESVFDYVSLLADGYWTHEDVEYVTQHPVALELGIPAELWGRLPCSAFAAKQLTISSVTSSDLNNMISYDALMASRNA